MTKENLFMDFERSLKALRRSPRLGKIYTIYQEQTKLTLSTASYEFQKKIYCLYLANIENLRADRLEPLFIQKSILMPLYQDEKYATLLNVTRLLVTILDFAKACKIIEMNPLKEIYILPLLKRSQTLMSKRQMHRPTLPYSDLRNRLMSVIKLFHSNPNRRRQMLLEISLRTILRPREVVTLKITDLDTKRKILNVHNTKTLQLYQLHVTERLEKILKESFTLFGSSNEGWLFAGIRNKDSHLLSQTLNKAMIDYGLKGILCAHGIRSIASNFFASHSDKVHPWVAEAMLQHSIGSRTARAYRHDDFFNERIKASIIWNNWLDGIYKQLRIVD